MARVAKYITDPAEFKRQYERVVKLRKELEDRKKELEVLIGTLEESSSLPQDVQDNLTSLKAESDNLSALLTSAKTYSSSIETYYKSWSDTKKKIDDEYQQAQDYNTELEGLVTKTSELEGKLTSERERATELLDDARNTLDIATDASISSVFKNRSKERKTARRWWTGAVFLAIGLFVGAIYYALSHIEASTMNDWSVWLLRLMVVTPFIYFLYFVTSQYTRERDLEERYAFKSLVAQTLQNNTKLLNDEFLHDGSDDKVEAKIIDFTIESMRGIYKEPHKNTTNLESRFRWNPRNAQIEAEAKAVEKSNG